MKGRCRYLDYMNNSCALKHGGQCTGAQECEDYEGEE
jgi:hypothetical protein